MSVQPGGCVLATESAPDLECVTPDQRSPCGSIGSEVSRITIDVSSTFGVDAQVISAGPRRLGALRRYLDGWSLASGVDGSVPLGASAVLIDVRAFGGDGLEVWAGQYFVVVGVSSGVLRSHLATMTALVNYGAREA